MLERLTFMRLRHTAVMILFRAGATIPEIAAITGHTIGSVNRIIDRYGLRDAITAGNAFQNQGGRLGSESWTPESHVQLRSLFIQREKSRNLLMLIILFFERVLADAYRG
jgi:hypothetical protein